MTTARRPAVLGGTPAFPGELPFARPLVPPLDEVMTRLKASYDRGTLTNGPLTRELEAHAAERLGVAHVVAVANCTAGLMLALRALGPVEKVVLPSFTFSASAHAIAWNGYKPVFAECDPRTLQLDVGDAGARLVAAGAGALLATHVYGAPAPIDAVTELCARRGVPCVFDAAHGLGAEHDGQPLGRYGTAEVFSMSPTKLVVAGEGGLVTTNDDDVAASIRIGRDYGDPGDYDTLFPGLNARMSEFHAAAALASFELLDEHVDRRRAIARRYREGLQGVAGLREPEVFIGDRSSYKDFSLIVEDAFGLDRDALRHALLLEGINTRPYFSPPVHRQKAYAHLPAVDLPVTDAMSGSVLSLPMFGDLRDDDVDTVVEVIGALHAHAAEITHRT